MTNVDIWSMTNVKVVNDKCIRDLWDICTSLGAVNDKCRHIVNDKCKVAFIQDHKGTPFEYFLGLFSANEKPLFWALNQSEALISARFSVLAESARLVNDKCRHIVNDKCRHMINDKCYVVNDKCIRDLWDICTSLGAVNDKCRHMINDKCRHMINDKCNLGQWQMYSRPLGHLHLLKSSQWQM